MSASLRTRGITLRSAMDRGRQKDCAQGKTVLARRRWQSVLCTVAKHRGNHRGSAFSSSNLLFYVAGRFQSLDQDLQNQLARRNRISATSFLFNFNAYSDADCLFYFRFRNTDICRLVVALAWPEGQTKTDRNRYAVSPIIATCIMLRRLASPARWRDLEAMFGKHASQLSEIFWEGIEHFVAARGHLLSACLTTALLGPRLEEFAKAVYDKSGCLENCIGFIDGTVLGIARPSGNMLQLSAYNGHKRKHSLKYQVVNTPDGMIMHVYGPVEGRRHDWTLYVRSELESILPAALDFEGKRYCIYGDSGYNRRWFMEVPNQGSNLTGNQKAFNKAMASVRITVEWIFKEVKLYFTTMDFKRKLKVLESPVGLLYSTSMLLCNMRNCLYPNQIARYFRCTPPQLEEYLAHE